MRRSLGKLSKRSRALGRAARRLTINGLISSFEVGNTVSLDHQSKYSGMPHPRYRGRTGRVVEKRGGAYVVALMDGRMEKRLIVPSVHLRLISQE